MTAIIIPAHNEGRGIARLLEAIQVGQWDAEVVVVANGCTDGTADIARSCGAVVLETPVPSKIKALALGDASVSRFPRLYIDGDVVIGAADVRALCAALDAPGMLAAGPSRLLPMEGVSRPVRMFYSVWQQLDGVRDELFGRGVIAVNEAGHARISDWPDLMSDDLHIALGFQPHERTIASDAFVTIYPPRTYRDLLRRRIRAMQGNRAVLAGADPVRARRTTSTAASLGRLVRTEPRRLPDVAVFLATAAVAKARGRWAALRGETQWRRDESSRLS